MTLSAAERISPFPPIQRRKTINAHLSPYERRNPHEPNPSELADHLSGRRSHLVLADTDGTQTGRLAHLRGFRRNRAWLHSSPDADRRHCLHLTHLLLLYGALEDESGLDGLWQRHHLADRLGVLRSSVTVQPSCFNTSRNFISPCIDVLLTFFTRQYPPVRAAAA